MNVATPARHSMATNILRTSIGFCTQTPPGPISKSSMHCAQASSPASHKRQPTTSQWRHSCSSGSAKNMLSCGVAPVHWSSATHIQLHPTVKSGFLKGHSCGHRNDDGANEDSPQVRGAVASCAQGRRLGRSPGGCSLLNSLSHASRRFAEAGNKEPGLRCVPTDMLWAMLPFRRSCLSTSRTSRCVLAASFVTPTAAASKETLPSDGRGTALAHTSTAWPGSSRASKSRERASSSEHASKPHRSTCIAC
mmetsp:Transcript_69239/g.129253  ORF Transcript_69239/g.129253 Transcript_69239/m.129253 type:complete len:250 (-) Transcript_69239:137-886(-)